MSSTVTQSPTGNGNGHVSPLVLSGASTGSSPPTARRISQPISQVTFEDAIARMDGKVPPPPGRRQSSSQLLFPLVPSRRQSGVSLPASPNSIRTREGTLSDGRFASAVEAPTATEGATAPPTARRPADGADVVAAPESTGWVTQFMAALRAKGTQLGDYVDRQVFATEPVTVTPTSTATGAGAAAAAAGAAAVSSARGGDAASDAAATSLSSGFGGAIQRNVRHQPYPTASEDERRAGALAGAAAATGGGGGGGAGGGSTAGQRGMKRNVMVFDPARNPYGEYHAPVVQVVDENAEDLAGDIDGASNIDDALEFEVDLVSALHGYRQNMNECFGHLVAAALSTRSPEYPVTGAELKEAGRSPYLVRMIVEAGCLDTTDPVAQEEVQGTVDQLITADGSSMNAVTYAYIESFCYLPFIRLTYEQYSFLKQCGFEYVLLMRDNRHVLPEQPAHSIVVNYCRTVYILNAIMMILSLCTTIFCTIAIAMVLAKWMNDSEYQSYGFYTLIVYGCGYALHLIAMVFFTRRNQNEELYSQDENVFIPSPFSNVMPVIPLFDVMCVVAFFLSRRRQNTLLSHDILALSRLSAFSYCVFFAFPQLLVQVYFNRTDEIDPSSQHQWPYDILKAAVVLNWATTLIRFLWYGVVYDSINGFGFAEVGSSHSTYTNQRHRAVPGLLNFLMAFLVEASLFYMISTAIENGDSDCLLLFFLILILTAVASAIMCVHFLFLAFTSYHVIWLSFTCIPITLITIAVQVLSYINFDDGCSVFQDRVFGSAYLPGYMAWIPYYVAFVMWIILMIMWIGNSCCGLNCFPHLRWPSFFSSKEEAASDDGDEGGGGGGDGGNAPTERKSLSTDESSSPDSKTIES